MISRVVVLFILASAVVKVKSAVTNEDIRIAILQIVNVVRNTDDKLERHEYREKVLGEQLKKGLVNIDKRIKLLDPLKGTVSRIDERLAAVETILMQKDKEEKEKQMQQQKIYEAILDLQKNLPIIIDQLNQDLSQKILMSTPPAAISEPMMTKKDFTSMENEIVDKMEKVTATINNVEKELTKIRDENINSIKDISKKSNENLDKVKRQLDNSENLLAKYENKLAEYNNRIPQIDQRFNKEDDEWKDNLLNALEAQKIHAKEIINDIKLIQKEVGRLPSKDDINYAQNNTLYKIEQIKQTRPPEGMPVANGALDNLTNTLREMKTETAKNHEVFKGSFNELTDITSSLTESFSKNYENIRTEISNMGKLEKVVMQTADSVLDTKRRLEYSVHQIVSEIGKRMKEGTGEINQGINERFDQFELSILDEDGGALHNLTSKIQEEIGRVWRQIGIMHQQMSASTDTLNNLKNQTDTYVTGSLDVMDSMKGKVSQITGRMSEVDENLNFLLGKLSLMSQEFNRIKLGLGSTLDEIRNSFQKVQDKIKDKGPGPHKISTNEIIDGQVATSQS